MNINIDQAIRDLLYENPVVIVPGLGGFATSPSSATVDYVQGIVQPPSRKIEFNQNLVINDGMLVNRLQALYSITAQEASEQISGFVEEIKLALDRRQIVEVPKVGRIYKDFEQNIRFTPEGENFNMEAFGLPPVQFAPLVKEKMQPATAMPETMANTAAPPRHGSHAAKADSGVMELLHRLLPWLVLLSALLLALLVYLKFSGPETEKDGIARERLNVKPSPPEETLATEATDEAKAATPPPAGKTSDAALGAGAALLNENTAPATTQKPTPAEPGALAGQQTTYLVIHSFGVRANATRFATELSRAGFAPETQKVGNLYRVGVVIPHDTRAELEAAKLKLGQQFKAVPKTSEELDEELGRQGQK